MTDLDDKLVPKVEAIIAKVGIAATFVTYPSRSSNTNTSVVTDGSATNVAATISPLFQDMIEITDDGISEQVEASKCYLATAAGTATAITFTPTIGQKVTVGTETSRILKLKRINTGAQNAAWAIWLSR